MGKLVHDTALKRGHEIVALLDKEQDWFTQADNLKIADVVIDFSQPHTVLNNIERCFNYKVPMVTGTTGWNEHMEDIKIKCVEGENTLLFAPNFSLGVNIFFAVNRYLAQLMTKYAQYDVSVKEVHHTSKLDAPSGTAVKIAQDILKINKLKDKWINNSSDDISALQIISERLDNITGEHRVIYHSEDDEIVIEHKARNRNGFALGAVIAAEWLMGRKGFYTMEDVLAIE